MRSPSPLPFYFFSSGLYFGGAAFALTATAAAATGAGFGFPLMNPMLGMMAHPATAATAATGAAPAAVATGAAVSSGFPMFPFAGHPLAAGAAGPDEARERGDVRSDTRTAKCGRVDRGGAARHGERGAGDGKGARGTAVMDGRMSTTGTR